VLTPIGVHSIDAALDAVLEHATLLGATRPEASAGNDEEISVGVELCRASVSSATKSPIVAPDHPDGLTATSTVSASLVRPTLGPTLTARELTRFERSNEVYFILLGLVQCTDYVLRQASLEYE